VKFCNLFFSFLILNSFLLSYEDSDIDGVDDTIDLCPNTSFDKLVDKNGCPQDEIYRGKLTLQIGTDLSIDEDNNQIKNYNFVGNYNYKKWNLSLSNSQQTTYDSNNNPIINSGDLYANLGYSFNLNPFESMISIGTKIATASEKIGTGENDYFSQLNINYFINNKIMIFSQIGYTLTGDTPYISYKNSLAYSLGTGYSITAHYYSSLSYDYAQSIYNSNPDYQSLSWLNSYSFLNDYFISLNYTHGLDEISYPHTFSLNLGVTFE
jgi:hypothetical protein